MQRCGGRRRGAALRAVGLMVIGAAYVTTFIVARRPGACARRGRETCVRACVRQRAAGARR
jgi:hypothetical protein